MKNKDLVYEFIQKSEYNSNQNKGLKTSYIAEKLNMKRSNVSSLLNMLVKEGKLIKLSGRPVQYLLPDRDPNDPFNTLIGYDDSLKSAIKQAKAAILYPAGALRFSIYAANGSGSTTFIKAAVKFAQKNRVIAKDCNIFQINCRNYAGDPDYLNDKLFMNGEKHQDCFQIVQNNVLIVNHYEFLNSQQISKLAQIIDDLSNETRGVVIFTANDTVSRKLDFPIEIHLPSLKDRTYVEKLQLIEKFFNKEAVRASKDIVVSQDVMKALILADYSHNLKDLKNYIVMACANAYIRVAKHKNANRIYVHADDFPYSVSSSLMNERSANIKLNSILSQRNKYIFSTDQASKYNLKDKNVYTKLSDQYAKLEENGISDKKANNIIKDKIKQLFAEYHYSNSKDKNHNLVELSKIVPLPIIQMIDRWLQKTEKKLNSKFDDSIFYGLCLHLNSIINLRVRNEDLSDEKIRIIFSKNPIEYKSTIELADKIKKEFNCELSDSEIAIIITFLKEKPHEKIARPVLLYALHGDGAAKRLSEVTNTLNKSNNSYGYDMNLEKASHIVYQELKALMNKIDQGKGIIVIYDMGSFKAIFDNLAKETGISVRLIQMPITLVGLEVARKSMTEENIDNVYHNVTLNLNKFSSAKNNTKHDLVITLCHTGEGGAISLKNYIEQYSNLGFYVKALSISNKEKLASEVEELRKIYNVVAFVGTYNPNLYGIPFISIKSIFETPKKDLDKILRFIPLNDDDYIYEHIYANLKEILVYTPVFKVKEVMPKVLDSLATTYDLDEGQKVGLFMHIVMLVENILSGNKTNTKGNNDNIDAVEFNDDYKIVFQQMRLLENAFNIVFTNNDIYMIVKIVKKIV